MTRRPNPWFVIPVSVGALVGGGLGYLIAAIGCRPGSCVPLATGVAVVAGLAAAAGVGTVVVLAIRSLEEWRRADRRGMPAPGPGCELPSDDADAPERQENQEGDPAGGA